MAGPGIRKSMYKLFLKILLRYRRTMKICREGNNSYYNITDDEMQNAN